MTPEELEQLASTIAATPSYQPQSYQPPPVQPPPTVDPNAVRKIQEGVAALLRIEAERQRTSLQMLEPVLRGALREIQR